MAAPKPTAYVPANSDASVREKTGRSWNEWFTLLDAWGVAEHGHTAAAAWLEAEHGVSAWWAQQVTVEYERSRGLREIGQRSGGKFATSAQRTVTAPPKVAFDAILLRFFPPEVAAGLKEGAAFLTVKGNEGTVSKIVPSKRLRLRWLKPAKGAGSTIEITIEARGDGRSTIRLDHDGIPSKDVRDEMKVYWKTEMDALASGF